MKYSGEAFEDKLRRNSVSDLTTFENEIACIVGLLDMFKTYEGKGMKIGREEAKEMILIGVRVIAKEKDRLKEENRRLLKENEEHRQLQLFSTPLLTISPCA